MFHLSEIVNKNMEYDTADPTLVSRKERNIQSEVLMSSEWYVRIILEGNDRIMHNIFYDLWLSFGCTLSSLIIGWIIFSLRKLFIVKEKNERQLIIIFFSIASCLIFSATLFTNYYFFILLGLLLSVKVNKIKS